MSVDSFIASENKKEGHDLDGSCPSYGLKSWIFNFNYRGVAMSCQTGNKKESKKPSFL